MEDSRSLAELAREALDIQNACNVSGLVFGWARCMKRFNELVKLGTDERNHHPIHVLWSDKLASLTGAQYGHNYSQMYSDCEKLAKGEVTAAVTDPVEELPF